MRGPRDSGLEDAQTDADPGDGDCDGASCDAHASCVGEGTDAHCVCDAGYTGDGESCSSATVNECSDADDCGDNAECVDDSAGKHCECADGFTGDGTTCEATATGCAARVCDPNASCEGSDDSCTCGPGFDGDGEGCGDVDECAEASAFECADHAACVNTFGGYDCACEGPFAGNGDSSCRPLCDIAKEDSDVCSPDGLCRVDRDLAVCDACEPGWSGTGKSCSASASACGAECDGTGSDEVAHAVCAGSSSCECAPGYSGTPATGCDDIDECEEADACGVNASCSDLDGGYFCECAAGYAKNDDGECVDKNECDATVSPCHPNATCTNASPEDEPNGFTCACKEGYAGDGSICRDINECAEDDACEANATCTNTAGGRDCECKRPFAADDSGACYCDLSGTWAMRQDVDTCWEELDFTGTDVTLISTGEMEASVWELHKLTYDGETIQVEKKGCGADNTPDFTSPHFGETYSSYVPLATFDPLDLARGNDINEPGLVPGSMFVTDDEAAVVGIDLGDDPVGATWPASHTEVDNWVDTDNDGQPGLTAWPRLPSQNIDDMTAQYNYLPARPDLAGMIAERAGCVSVAARVITRLEVDMTSCTHMVGEVVNVKTEGRVQGCTLVHLADEGDDITCNADDWESMDQCIPTDLDNLDDDQNQSQSTKSTFELVRIADLDDEVSCLDVRDALPAIERDAPSITCRD